MSDTITSIKLSVRKFRVKLAIFFYNLIVPKDMNDDERAEIFVYKLRRNKTFQKLIPMATCRTPDLTIERTPPGLRGGPISGGVVPGTRGVVLQDE